MEHAEKPIASKKAIENAQMGWDYFTRYGKWTVIAIISIMIIMGLVFIDW